MPKSLLKTLDHYPLGPRSQLVPGDRFRVGGGPYYRTSGGGKVPMVERGVFVFSRYCELGASRWIEAYRVNSAGLTGAMVILYVGKPRWGKVVPEMRLRPYTIRKVK